jgi:hypothetical protein
LTLLFASQLKPGQALPHVIKPEAQPEPNIKSMPISDASFWMKEAIRQESYEKSLEG